MLLNYLSRIKDYLSQNYILSRILTLLLALGIIVLLFVFIWGGQANKDKEVSLPLAVEKEDKTVLASNQNEDNKNHKNQVAEKILVDLKGAVQKEGVYHLKPGSRVTDLIQEAGGLTEEADRNAINLAQKLKDEEVIYIAKKEKIHKEWPHLLKQL
ncbi:SLBB domain-containing protein [Streptococcus didelphis]|uniref:SLBB domain-containing protein n=1 Tax=Streptococcus didelphis TaxID=102886 RepID=A0ABY9LGT9_9STRE|nr:SLBB domain-containing protein [Streptococcus didelphis]WMB28086.1 SLBB domain-containing protein [Streptococcus didelphis]